MNVKEVIRLYNLAEKHKETYRRHAAENMRNGGKGLKIGKSSKLNVRKQLAASCGISEDTYRKLDKVMQSDNPDLINMLKDGEISINLAYRFLQDDVVVEKVISLYIFYAVIEGDKKEICMELCWFGFEQHLDKVPKHLRTKFIVLYNRCKNEVINSRQNSGSNNYSQSFQSSLGVNAINIDEWKIFYRDLARLYHPDNGGDPDKFRRLQEFDKKIRKS